MIRRLSALFTLSTLLAVSLVQAMPFHIDVPTGSIDDTAFCKLTVSTQPEIGSIVSPNSTTWIMALKNMWIGENGKHPVLSLQIHEYLSKFAYPFFEQVTGVPIKEITPRDLLRFRTQNIPRLKAIMDRTQMLDLQAGAVNDENAMARFFDSLHAEIQKAAAQLGLTRDHFLLPGAFMNKQNVDGNQTFSFWDLSFTKNRLSSRYRMTTLVDQKTFGMDLWIKIIARYGILPISAFDGFYYHDIFGHVFAALVHPYEELYLQRQFYKKLDEIIDTQTGLDQKRQLKVALETGNLIFESQEIPHVDALNGLTHLTPSTRKTLLNFSTDEDSTIIDAEKLIANRQALTPEIQNLLAEFKDKIVAPHAGFYESAEFYGGDFYDVRNHYSRSLTVRNFVDEGYAFSLEHLRIRALAEPTADGPALIRLFTAYHNAAQLKIDFKKIYDGAITGASSLANSTVQIPWRKGPVTKYWRSYAGREFKKFLDRFDGGFQDYPLQ